MSIGPLPSLSSKASHFVFERLPPEVPFLKNGLQHIVPFELLLSRFLLVILQIVVQVDSNACTVHRAPNVVKTLVDEFFEKVLVDG